MSCVCCGVSELDSPLIWNQANIHVLTLATGQFPSLLFSSNNLMVQYTEFQKVAFFFFYFSMKTYMYVVGTQCPTASSKEYPQYMLQHVGTH